VTTLLDSFWLEYRYLKEDVLYLIEGHERESGCFSYNMPLNMPLYYDPQVWRGHLLLPI